MTERIWLNEDVVEAPPATWWSAYRASCGSTMSQTALEVLDADCEYVVRQLRLTATEPGFRSGMVMGAVQSGKTASMLGVVAKSIDSGADLVVVLAGTRTSLLRQTHQRLHSELRPPGGRSAVVIPSVALLQGDGDRPSPSETYALPGARVRAARRRGQPIVVVVMKQVHHLAAASQVLRQNVYPTIQKEELFRVVVLDDEADDGSVLDAEIERRMDPTTDHIKQIPRFIAGLWSRPQAAPEPVHESLQVTYVGYTATPQANFLQSDQNPLSPRDFICALRTPYDSGSVVPRTVTYRVDALPAYYIGGDAFYSKLATAPPEAQLIQPVPESDLDRGAVIADAIRGFLVAGAIRTLRSGLSPVDVGASVFASRAEAQEASPAPHTMLFHPSSAKEEHFAAAAEVLAWGRGVSKAEAEALVREGERALSRAIVEADIAADRRRWLVWLDAYRATAHGLARAYGLEETRHVPGAHEWDAVRRVLVEQVVEAVRVSVVNSDPEADDRPEFDPEEQPDGTWRAGRDLMTIFVSGNVMARGLTLDGLTTTLFLRTTDSPAADTQVQMQRWFGYRGRDLELCRVMAPADQLSLFRQYHEVDVALRTQILKAMERAGDGPAPSPLVLEGALFAATAKIAGISKTPLCPGATPFINRVNVTKGGDDSSDPNIELLASTFASGSAKVVANGRVRGLIRPEPVSMLDAADLLDRLAYDDYRPSGRDPLAQRWTAQELSVGVEDGDPRVPFLRLPAAEDSDEGAAIEPRRCPYTIAAYLRFWSVCLARRAPGHFPTDDANMSWDHLDLSERRRLQPRFYIGLRFGSGDLLHSKVLGELDGLVHPMVRPIVDGRVKGDWGSQARVDPDSEYHGDKLFDYAYHGMQPVPVSRETGALWRPVGAPGLILFQLILPEGSEHPSVAVGVSLPLGGPDHFASRTKSAST